MPDKQDKKLSQKALPEKPLVVNIGEEESQRLKELMYQKQSVIQRGITSPNPLVVMIGDPEIFKRIKTYNPELIDAIVKSVINQEDAHTRNLDAQTEAVKYLPEAGRAEKKIAFTGQLIGTAVIFSSLLLAAFMTWRGYAGFAATVAVAGLTPTLISSFMARPKATPPQSDNPKTP